MADTQPYRSKPRGYETAKDMAWTLIPLFVLVLVVVYFLSPRDQDPIKTVDTGDDISSLAEFGSFPVVAPAGLSKQWRPTSSILLRDGDSDSAPPVGLTIGYVTPKGTFARFTIRQGDPQKVLVSAVDQADVERNPSGPAVSISGREWTPFTTSRGHGYLSSDGDGVVLIVAGGAADAQLRELAGSLRDVPKR